MDRTALEAMTVPALRSLADDLDVEIPSGTRKAGIIDRILDGRHDEPDEPDGPVELEVDLPADPEPGLDPKLAAIRDEARAREARTGRTRHTIARIDPHLIELRRIAAARDAASVRPATSPLPR